MLDRLVLFCAAMVIGALALVDISGLLGVLVVVNSASALVDTSALFDVSVVVGALALVDMLVLLSVLEPVGTLALVFVDEV